MENNTNTKISVPQAIIVAGVLIMVGILITNKPAPAKVEVPKTLSEQVGVSKDSLISCIQSTDMDALDSKIKASVNSAMKGLPSDQRGTPYSIVIGKNGSKADIHGADSYENAKATVDAVMAGKVAKSYAGDLPPVDLKTEHVFGNPDAEVTIVEYSDFECPYCKAFNPTLKKIVSESNGHVNWVYRHWPLHQHSFEKLVAAECVAKIKGNDAFWQYGDLLFGSLQTSLDPITDKL